ncbi:PREDICTED: uncharacterized protein LOC107098861 [Cyprinodon variegatus]|uniref:uncharacterized protein LOC107098861 n=1 Tax=Cyprinodon variegatus TaxID=28743 RepID=UPI0007425C8C|nr:PREDICTED: uncharacterized protein LOC107098861 [Cyprinodon variegatus]
MGNNMRNSDLQSQDAETKYKDIISKSKPLRSGTPALYQVKPKQEIIENLTRLTIGERNLNKTNRTILLVGETGAGKSALVNALFNYTMGVKFEDEIWFQIVEEKKESQVESQTTDVIVYEIFGFETLPFSLTIIDTPGFGDTRGPEHDEEVAERLLDWFQSEDGVHEVNAVGLVTKATDNRLTDHKINIVDSVMSLFGKNLQNKIVLLATHSNGRKPKKALRALEKAGIKCAKNEEDEAVHFKFDNCQEEERTENTEYIKSVYQISENGFRELTMFLEKTAPQKLMTTKKVLKERKKLTASIQNLEERIKSTELKQTEIKQIQEALKRDGNKNSVITVEVDEAYKVKKPYESGGGHCTVCIGKCPASSHVKVNWIYETKTKKVQRIIEKPDKDNSESQRKMSTLESYEDQLKQLTAEKMKFIDEAFQHIVRLHQIALRFNSRKTVGHLEFLIEKMEDKGDREKLRKLQEIKTQLVNRDQQEKDKPAGEGEVSLT